MRSTGTRLRTTQDSAGRDHWQGLASRLRIALLPDLAPTPEEVMGALDFLQVVIDFHKPPLDDYKQLSDAIERLAQIAGGIDADTFRH